MMTDEERYLFDLQGYLVIDDVLKPDELDDLNHMLDEYDLWNESPGQDGFFDFWRNGDRQISAGPLHRFARRYSPCSLGSVDQRVFSRSLIEAILTMAR